MNRPEEEFFNSSLGKIFKMIEIWSGNESKKEQTLDDLPIATSMKDIV